MKWAYVFAIVGATMVCDYLQASAGKAHAAGRSRNLFGQWRIGLSVVFMALSFFAFTQLLAVADLSFAVPATALTIPAETFMARYVLRENVNRRRWAGAWLVAAGVALIAL
jgi:drug/metabolite transporter (DMT)-like permease